MIEALKEAQRIQQEEEERLRLEAEEEEKRQEELEEARLEADRKEQERKEKKKQKEKERKERLKAEGKLLTPKQKADRARAQAMLESLGVASIPAGEKKVRPGTRIRPNKKSQQQQQGRKNYLFNWFNHYLFELAHFFVQHFPQIKQQNLYKAFDPAESLCDTILFDKLCVICLLKLFNAIIVYHQRALRVRTPPDKKVRRANLLRSKKWKRPLKTRLKTLGMQNLIMKMRLKVIQVNFKINQKYSTLPPNSKAAKHKQHKKKGKHQ